MNDIEVKLKLISTLANQVNAEVEKTKGSFTQLTGMAQGYQTSFTNMTSAIGRSWAGMATGMVVGFAGYQGLVKGIELLKDAHKEATAHRTVVNQLTASLGYFSNALVMQAEAMEKTNFVHSEEVMGAQQRLSLYIKEEDSIKKLMPAVLNLAKAKGIDLVSAANLVAVAYSKGENATNKDEASVGRLGITFKKTGDATRDVAALTDALNVKFGSQAKAVSDSLDGWDKLGFKIGEVTKNIGLFLFGVSENEKKAIKYNDTMKEISADEELRKKMIESGDAAEFSHVKKEVDFLTKRIEKKKEWIAAQDKEIQNQKANAAMMNLNLTPVIKTKKDEEEEKKRIEEAKKSAEETAKVISEQQEFLAKDELERMAFQGKKKQEEIDKYNNELEEKNKKLNLRLQKEDNRAVENEKKILEEKKKMKALEVQFVTQAASKTLSIANNTSTVQLNNIEAEKQSRLDLLETTNMSEDAKAKKRDQINKEAAAKEREVKKQQQNWAVGEALISGAVAIMKDLSTYGYIAGGIMGVLDAAVTISQIAAIKSQKFAAGLDAGPVQQRYGSGGTDSEPAMLTPGERVLTPAQYSSITNANQNHHYDMSITVTGSADASTVRAIRATQHSQVLAIKRTMQSAGRMRQLA
jgi:hypothetical protein